MLHIRKQIDLFRAKGGDVKVDVLDLSLVALQGPAAVGIIERLTAKTFTDFGFMTSRRMDIQGIYI